MVDGIPKKRASGQIKNENNRMPELFDNGFRFGSIATIQYDSNLFPKLRLEKVAQ